MYNKRRLIRFTNFINPLVSPSAGAPALKYGDVNTVTPPGEVKGLINNQKLIGIHYGNSKQFDYNKGTLLIYNSSLSYLYILINLYL